MLRTLVRTTFNRLIVIFLTILISGCDISQNELWIGTTQLWLLVGLGHETRAELMRNADISRLPAIWDQGEYSETVCEYLKRAFNLDAPTRGEWGYTTEDAVIFERPSGSLPVDYVAWEWIFVEKRIYSECIVFRPTNDRFCGIEWKLQKQRLLNIRNPHLFFYGKHSGNSRLQFHLLVLQINQLEQKPVHLHLKVPDLSLPIWHILSLNRRL